LIAIHGHRGCRGLFPENTIPAFRKAITLGVDAIEMDLAISKDLQVVVTHEPYMSRRICLDPNGDEIPEKDDMQHNLFKMSYEEIAQFDCGLKYRPEFPNQKNIRAQKPMLSEVIKISKAINPDIKFNLEIKSKSKYDHIFTPNPELFTELVLEVIQKNDVLENSNLQSFDLRILEQVKMQSSKMKVAILIDKYENTFEKLSKLSFQPEILSPDFSLIDAKIIDHFHKLDMKIIPWTVNSETDLLQMINLNVDGIITDYPDRLIKLLTEITFSSKNLSDKPS